jgi:putative phage-type endonuclease
MIDVTIDRENFIGGSDIATILGINPFKTRLELLREKAGLVENTFDGNIYTDYGNVMEKKIIDYLNELYKTEFKPKQALKGYLRAHTDGFNGKVVVEVKTTSKVLKKGNYDYYICQLLLGMKLLNVDKGILAVYERPKDFNEEFDKSRLQIIEVDMDDYFMAKILLECELFWEELQEMKGDD